MEERNYIEFTSEEFDEIVKYMELIEAETVQDAVLTAVRNAIGLEVKAD